MLTDTEMCVLGQAYGSLDIPKKLLNNVVSIKMAWQRVVSSPLPAEMICCAVGMYGVIASALRPSSPWDVLPIDTPIKVFDMNRNSCADATFQGRCNSPHDEQIMVDINGDSSTRRLAYMWNCTCLGKIPLEKKRKVDGKEVDLPEVSPEIGVTDFVGVPVDSLNAECDVPNGIDGIPFLVDGDVVPEDPPITGGIKQGDFVEAVSDVGLVNGIFAGLLSGGRAEILVDGKSFIVDSDCVRIRRDDE